MAAVGAEVTGPVFLPSGVISFFIILLLLSIFLTALCSECSRRSFELQDSEVDKDPSTLIRVVKLEEAIVARENPMINAIQNDEKEFSAHEENTVSFTPWRSHLGAPQSHQESNPKEENSVSFTPWRSHLNQDLNSSTPPEHIYHTIGEGRSSSDADVSSLPTNHEQREEHCAPSAAAGNPINSNTVYAQISKKAKPTTPPGQTPEEVEEVVSDRKTQLEG